MGSFERGALLWREARRQGEVEASLRLAEGRRPTLQRRALGESRQERPRRLPARANRQLSGSQHSQKRLPTGRKELLFESNEITYQRLYDKYHIVSSDEIVALHREVLLKCYILLLRRAA